MSTLLLFDYYKLTFEQSLTLFLENLFSKKDYF